MLDRALNFPFSRLGLPHSGSVVLFRFRGVRSGPVLGGGHRSGLARSRVSARISVYRGHADPSSPAVTAQPRAAADAVSVEAVGQQAAKDRPVR